MQIVLNGVGVFSQSGDTENMQLHNSNRHYAMLATLFYCFVLLSDPIHLIFQGQHRTRGHYPAQPEAVASAQHGRLSRVL